MAEWTLGIDTSTDVRAGLAYSGAAEPATVWALAERDPRAHAELLTPLLERLVCEAGIRLSDVDRFAVGVGPGPFTGLRVGIATARTLASLSSAPITGVCSLDIMAWQAVDAGLASEEFVVVSDARRRELYWAQFRGRTRVRGPFVGPAVEVPQLPVVGTASSLYAEVLGDRVVAGTPTQLDAGVLAAHVDQLADAGLEPLYLRAPDAQVPGARKTVVQRAQPQLKGRM